MLARDEDGSSDDEVVTKTRGKYGKWSEDGLKKAIDAVKSKDFGLNAAAREFKVPKGTLKRYLNQGRPTSAISKKKLGRPRVFSTEMEKALAEHILKFEERMFGLTIGDVRKLSYDLATRLGLRNNFSEGKKLAGKTWFYDFMKRHEHLSLRQPEATSMARIRGFSRERVNKFFDLLEEVVDRYHFDGTRIYNVDESGFNPVQKKPRKVVGKKGKNHIGAATSGERGVNTTVVCCCSASGVFVPPMFIFKRKKLSPELKIGAPTGSIVTISDTGYITSELFLQWLRHFQLSTASSKERPTLLLLDGHSTHSKNLDALLFSRDHGIHILQLPSHSTHRLQPLDVGFFRPLNAYYIQAVESYLRQHPGETVKVCNVTALLADAYKRAASVATAESSFRGAGVWPVNRLKFPDHLFAAAEAISAPSDFQQPHSPFVSALNEVSPLPSGSQATVSQAAAKTSGRQQNAELLTSTPYKAALELKKTAAEQKTKKCLKKKAKRALKFTDDATMAKKPKKAQYRDFVVIKFLTEEDNRLKFYVGELLESMDNGVHVKFLRKREGKKSTFFTFPMEDDSDVVPYSLIVGVTHKFTERRGKFEFSELKNFVDIGRVW